MTREHPPSVFLRGEDPPRWLVVRHSAPQAPRIVVGPSLRLGSARDNQVILDGTGVARRHCTLRRIGAHVHIYDHGSRAGTLVDGAPLLEPRLIRGPIRLIVGAHVLTVHPLRPSPNVTGLARGFCPPHDVPKRPAAIAAHGRRWAAPKSRRRGVLLHSIALGGIISASAWAACLIVSTLLAPTPDLRGPTGAQARASPGDRGTLDPVAPLASAGATREAAREGPFTGRAASERPDDHDRERPRTTPTTGQTSARRSTSRRHTVRRGETWSSLATARGVPLGSLRDANVGLRRPLRAGDRIDVPASSTDPAAPPLAGRSCGEELEIPSGSRSIGGVTLGALDDPLRMPQLDLYELRCPAHSYATATTTRALIDALRCFRGRTSYDGQIIIGDISAEQGGPLGPHLSHQSGRDVDLWLPIAGGRYGLGCDHCGTSYCRPEPEEIDWSATWQLIDTLAELPEVEVVFLDFDLQAKLRRAALESDANPATLDARVQWPRRGASALVQHADGHIHHMHIRFRCPPGERGCVGRPSIARDRDPLVSAR